MNFKMPHTWSVYVGEQEDRCIICRDDGLVRQDAPRSKLKQQMAPHGITDDLYDDLCRQLEKTSIATVAAIDLALPNSFNRKI
jgi:hypothetical protein